MSRHADLTEPQIHRLLSNDRRRLALSCLRERAGPVAVRALSEAVAAAESGTTPAPRPVRASVYTALHQTHLPTLENLGVVSYDRERRTVTPGPRWRAIERHRGVVSPVGPTWAACYRTLGVVALSLVVGSLAGVPLLDALDPLLAASAALAGFALLGGWELWGDRHRLLRPLRARRHGTATDGDVDRGRS